MLRNAVTLSARRAVPSQIVRPRFLSSRSNEALLEPGFVEKYKLDDPSRFVPISLGAAVFASATGLYHWNAESQILGLFILFTGTVYAKGGDAIGKMLDETADAVLKEQNALEDTQIAATKLVIDAHNRQAHVFKDIQEIFEGQKALMDQIVATHNLKLKHEVRNRIVRQLDHAVQVDEQFYSAVKSKMVDAATEYVRSQFESANKELQDKSLNASLSALNDLDQPVQTPVDSLFSSFFVKIKKELAQAKTAAIPVSEAARQEALEVGKAAARRDGLEGLEIKVPGTIELGSRA